MTSKRFKGKPLSEDLKNKIRAARLRRKERLGYLNSPETREKLSRANTGHATWSKGKKGIYPFETRRKMALAHMGKPLSKEHRERISLGNRGCRGANWQGGRTALAMIIRGSFFYRQWRSDVFTRDGFTCVLCGRTKCYVEADHFPKRFSSIITEYGITSLSDAILCDELWNLNNGRTLCKQCHLSLSPGRQKRDRSGGVESLKMSLFSVRG